MHASTFRTDPTSQQVPQMVCMSHYTRALHHVRRAALRTNSRCADRNVRKCMCSSVLLWKCRLLARCLGFADRATAVAHAPPADRLFMAALVLHVRPNTLILDTSDQCGCTAHVSALLQSASGLVSACTAPRPVGQTDARCRSAYHEFREAFTAWQQQDIADMMEVLVASYKNLQETRGHGACTEEVAAHVDRNMQTILMRVRSLGECTDAFLARVAADPPQTRGGTQATPTGTNRRDSVRERPQGSATAHQPPTHPTAATETIDEVVRRAFWDDFARRLEVHETDQLHALLTELVEAIANLTPRRSDLHSELRAEIDVDLIVQMVRHQCLDGAEFYRTTGAVVRRVAGLIAPARSPPLMAWYEEWGVREVGGGDPQRGTSSAMVSVFPAFLERMHTEIGLAQRACELVREEM